MMLAGVRGWNLAPAMPSNNGESGWSGLFWEAFRRSKNPMVLLDDHRCHVETNGAYLQLLGYPRSALIGRPVYELVVGGPIMSESEWHAVLRHGQFTGAADLRCAEDRSVRVEFAGHPEIVTGRQLVLFVVLTTASRGRRVPDQTENAPGSGRLTPRELEVIDLVALGMSGREVAAELQIAHDTVRTHMRNAMTKTGSRSRAQLVAKTLAEGLTWDDRK
jgi:DNA-binding CsgD family transcriptional regulator